MPGTVFDTHIFCEFREIKEIKEIREIKEAP